MKMVLQKLSLNDAYNNRSRITAVEMKLQRCFLGTLSLNTRHLRSREPFLGSSHPRALSHSPLSLRCGCALTELTIFVSQRLSYVFFVPPCPVIETFCFLPSLSIAVIVQLRFVWVSHFHLQLSCFMRCA